VVTCFRSKLGSIGASTVAAAAANANSNAAANACVHAAANEREQRQCVVINVCADEPIGPTLTVGVNAQAVLRAVLGSFEFAALFSEIIAPSAAHATTLLFGPILTEVLAQSSNRSINPSS
jgi:hypothetical protein